jgi:hypothetical protein
MKEYLEGNGGRNEEGRPDVLLLYVTHREETEGKKTVVGHVVCMLNTAAMRHCDVFSIVVSRSLLICVVRWSLLANKRVS